MTDRSSAGQAPVRVLVVCTGNVCRSPLAERLLRARASAAGIAADIRSAGTSALVLEDMTPETAALVTRYGGDAGDHRARQVTERLIATADLVLTASREHRGEIVALHPRASRYAYTLKQFARLVDAAGADGVSSDDVPGFLTDVAAMRGHVPPPARAEDDDIEDPYRRTRDAYARVGAIVSTAADSIVDGMSRALASR